MALGGWGQQGSVPSQGPIWGEGRFGGLSLQGNWLVSVEASMEHCPREQLEKVTLLQVRLGPRDTSRPTVVTTPRSPVLLVSLLGSEVDVEGRRTNIFTHTAQVL